MRTERSDMGSLEGRGAVITGAGSGLGRVFAAALADEGARVVVADIDAERATAAAADIAESGATAVGLAFDQSDPASVDAMRDAAAEAIGDIDILVNNASLFSTLARKRALEIEPEEWRRVVTVNLDGPFYCCRAFVPAMARRGYGKVVSIASSSIFAASNQLAHYVAAKAGVVGLTRALARECGDSGVTVNAVSPGATDSGAANASREYLQSKVGARSIRRVQVPSDLVGAIVFLSSPASDFITGQNLVVDGGAAFQ